MRAAAATIPRGETRPYGWIARQAGRPRAVRAAASALAANPVPLLIPCHRIVQADGVAGGSYNSSLAASTGSTVSTRNALDLYAARLLRWDNWFYAGVADFLQSSEQGIDFRTNLGGGVGRYLKNTNRTNIWVMGGLAWQNTRYSQSLG